MAVRRESVVLDLQTNMPEKAAESAAAIRLLREEVDKLGRSGSRSGSATRDVESGLEGIDRKASRGTSTLNEYTGRLKVMGQVAATLGPALIPIGAVGVPALAGLAQSAGFATIGLGVMVGAVQGVGDALKALNKAHLEPTEANLKAAREAMDQLSPAARDFTRELAGLEPQLKKLRDIGATNMLPGFSRGLDGLEHALPVVQRLVGAVAGELGNLGAEAGASLGSARWRDFFVFLEHEAPRGLDELVHGIGNLAHGFAELWMAFGPIDRDFSSWLLQATKDFDHWAAGLSQTQGFADFIDYIRTEGPVVGKALGAIANAVLQIVEAAAPLGGPVLHVITELADVVAKFADSDLGTPFILGLSALSLFNRGLSLTKTLTGTTFGTRAIGQMQGYGDALLATSRNTDRARMSVTQFAAAERQRRMVLAGGAAQLALFGVSVSGLADKMGVANTASLALAGSFMGPWGAAAGSAVGSFLDIKASADKLDDSLARLRMASASGDLVGITRALANARVELAQFQKQRDSSLLHPDDGVVGGHVLGGLIGIKTGPVTSTPTGDKVGQAKAEIAAGQAAQAHAQRLRELGMAMRYQGAQLTAYSSGLTLTASGAREAGMSIDQFRASIQRLSHGLDQQAALDAYKTALLDFGDALKRNGRTLSDSTRAGLENRAMLRGIAQAAIQAAEGMSNTGRASRYLDRARQGFIKAAMAAGDTRAQARRLADQFGLLDRMKVTPKIQVSGASQALSEAAQVRRTLASLNGTTAKMYLETTRRERTASAYGNVLFYSHGDVANRHVPQIARGGATRVWNEPETQGEAYIPFANDSRRPRAKAIAEQTVGILGGNVEWYARGGVSGRRTGESSLVAELRALRQTVAHDTARRDALASKRSDLASSVRSSFMSDPFTSTGSAWSSGGGINPLGALRADIAKARAFRTTLAKLHAKGVNGDALASIASTGDLTAAQSLLTSGQARSYETLYAQRTAAANAVGRYAGTASYGRSEGLASAELARANAELRHLNAQIAHLRHENAKHAKTTGNEVAKGVNGAAGHSQRHKKGTVAKAR